MTLEDKMDAVASVLFLLPEHYTMLRLGRSGALEYVNELEQGEFAAWRPPMPEEFEGWPVERVRAWLGYQRGLSRRYRLYAVGLALDKLRRVHPEQAMAVAMEYIEDGECTWYEPERVMERARAGLAFIAADVPGDVPGFEERPMSTTERDKAIRSLAAEGMSGRAIAREMGCSRVTVGAVLRGLDVRRGRVVSAGG